MANQIETWLKKKENRQMLFFLIGVICLYFYVKNKNKQSNAGYSELKTGNPQASGGGQSIPVKVINADGAIGSYSTEKAGRKFTFNRTPEFELAFNDDGTISDITPGLNTGGGVNTLNGQNVFYMIGYSIFENADGSYNKLQNVYLPDGIYSIRQFVCNPGKLPDPEAFRANINGWGDNGVNNQNARMSEIFISVFSKTRQGNGIAPDWLKVSRHLIFPSALQYKNWAQYAKFFASGYINKGDNQKKYQEIGVLPYVEIGNVTPQPNTWHTVMKGNSNPISGQELYDFGKHWMERLGSDKRSYLTDEIPENMQNTDADIYGKMQKFYAGAFDVLKSKGVTNKRDTGLYGPYGSDDYYGFISPSVLYASREDYERSLTTHLHKGYGINGFSAEDHEYYTRGHIDVRNVNVKYYFWNNLYQLPYEFLYVNEKVKLGTKTYGGQDRESNVTIFSFDKIESFVFNPQNEHINIELARTGEIIPFSNGEIHTQMNSQPPVPWDEMFTAGFWSELVLSGIAVWDAPGSAFGSDTTKLHWWTDQPVKWRQTGGNWQDYVSGQNGAPVNDSTGLTHSMFASPVDAAAAGMEIAWEIRNRMQSLKHIAYNSNRGGFTPTPGQSGLHLNGFGPINMNLFVARDLVEAKKAVCLDCSGAEGGAIIYYNGYLPAHEYEDVTVKGISFRAYGRQTIVKLY